MSCNSGGCNGCSGCSSKNNADVPKYYLGNQLGDGRVFGKGANFGSKFFGRSNDRGMNRVDAFIKRKIRF